MNAVIVDDEPLARQIIREYLEDFPEITVVAECRTGKQAVKTINELKPDVVFLDIRMPGMDGFTVLEHLTFLPRIIFSTAYGDYAIKAFDVNAVDYLLKPYDRKRFSKAVQRVLHHPQLSHDDLDRLVRAISSVHEQATYPAKIFVRAGKKILAVNVEDILWIEAEGDYTNLHTDDKEYLCNLSLTALEERLDPARFLRIHRSSIIASTAVEHLQSDGEGGFVATLKNGARLRISRTYADKVKSLIW